MPTSKRRKKPTKRRPPGPRTRPSRLDERGIPPIDSLVRAVLKGGREVKEVEDPLEAELWASSMLGTFYKLPIPLHARIELERSIEPAIVRAAERAGDAGCLAILVALAAVGDGETGTAAREAATRIAGRGEPEPVWAEEIGRPAFVDAWVLTDPYGDQQAYYATFRYPGREPHVVMALLDENLGGIIKDAFARVPTVDFDIRERAEAEPGATVEDVEPRTMAGRIVAAIEIGDQYLDNDWTQEFKDTRALLQARMRRLDPAALPEPPEPPGEDARAALIEEFLASPFAPDLEQATSIAERCIEARCDYGDGDPLRWSPIVVELFMLDFLPRKAVLDTGEIRAVPDVLRGWVRFVLTKRGLQERWIEEAVEAVGRFAPEFRRAATDQGSFGPAKSIVNAMIAAGVDPRDPRAAEEWIAGFNALPFEERDAFLGPIPGEPDG